MIYTDFFNEKKSFCLEYGFLTGVGKLSNLRYTAYDIRCNVRWRIYDGITDYEQSAALSRPKGVITNLGL
jgi:hypothetical protein